MKRKKHVHIVELTKISLNGDQGRLDSYVTGVHLVTKRLINGREPYDIDHI